MTKEQFATQIDGREIGEEISRTEEQQAANAGLLVVFGYSDDNVEFKGLFSDEVGAYDETAFRIDTVGILKSWEQVVDAGSDEKEAERYFKSKGRGKTITALFGVAQAASWIFHTDIPHATFKVMEGEEVFCIGLVIERKDLE